MDGIFDVAIIGGGINGCGVARDASGRGLSVYLCEQADLASGTSSAATKLIHGGLRYLEYFEFRLVRESLIEREVLWAMAPHLIRPLRFVLPHQKGLRPAWMLRLGLFVYDHLGGRKLLPSTRTLDLRSDPAGKPLKAGEYSRAFEYSDCWVDDARMVVLNARDAVDRGAVIQTRTRAVSAQRHRDHWRVTTLDTRTGREDTITARLLINAAGPWVGEVMALTLKQTKSSGVRLVQGSHIIVPKLYAHDRCYIFQNADKRITFVIPYEQDFTLIGTTDLDYVGDPAAVRATTEEIDYLCSMASAYFAQPIAPADVVWSYSGVRPLFDDGATDAQAATRDYVLELDDQAGAPLLTIFGGKLTTYRRLAQHALEKFAHHLPATVHAKREWATHEHLPGGDFPVEGFEALCASIGKSHPWLDSRQLHRMVRAYGTNTSLILGNATSEAALGRDFGAGLSQAEVGYLMDNEWAETVEDVIWRRSKLGLRLSSAQVAALAEFIEAERHARAVH